MAPARGGTDVVLSILRGPEGCARVIARGDLDGASVRGVREALEALITSGCPVVTLDLTDLTFMDSAGHRGLRSVADLAEHHGGELLLDGCSRAVRRFLDVTVGVLAGATTARDADSTTAIPVPARGRRAIGF